MQIVTEAQLAALREFKSRAVGRGWKGSLRSAWETGYYPNAIASETKTILQALRNTHGPSWLDGFRGGLDPREHKRDMAMGDDMD